jgi:hypothetical protein
MSRALHIPKTALLIVTLVVIVSAVGCRAFQYNPTQPNLYGQQQLANPLVVSMMDRWLVMDQVSDELDNYFKIYREERIRVMDGIMSEGWIETHPKAGGTLLEPWRQDSTAGFEKLHATLQSVRRFAKVRVIPAGNAYQVDVKVFKELEDLDQPVGAAVGGQIFRHDSALDVERTVSELQGRSAGWIPMGRDVSLEQLILRNIQSRLNRVVEGCAPVLGQ